MNDKQLYDALLLEVDAGNVTSNENGSLIQFSYSRECMFSRKWNEVTEQARGIIFTRPTMGDPYVVARPFPKFFNHGEITFGLPDEPFTVATKEDGSLIIIFYADNQWQCATKGSFFSYQAVWANKLLRETTSLDDLNRNLTYCAEYVGPDNQVVIRYDKSELVMLGAYNTREGTEIFPPPKVGMIRNVELASFDSVDDIVEICKFLPPDQEGFVVRFTNGYRIKIKGDEYVKLHKLMSSFTPLGIWDSMRKGLTYVSMAMSLPEEFHTELQTHYEVFLTAFTKLYNDVQGLVHRSKNWTDKEVGLSISGLRSQNAITPAHDFVFAARKKNWFVEVCTPSRMRDAAFDTFRPTDKTLLGRYYGNKPNTEN